MAIKLFNSLDPLVLRINQNKTLIFQIFYAVYLDSEQSESHHLTLREYQKELAAPSLKGQNSIICAPANSGKTYVAIHIARNHLDKCTDVHEEGKHDLSWFYNTTCF